MSSFAARSASRTASSTESRSTPGIEATGTRVVRAVDDEQRPDQVVGGEHVLAHHAPRPFGLAVAPHAGGEVERRRRAPAPRPGAARPASIGRPNLMAMAYLPDVACRGQRWHRYRTGLPPASTLGQPGDGRTMDFDLTEEQRAIQDTARDFARAEMMPHARDWDENEIFPVETLRKAAALGFGGIYVKDDVGGSALTRLDATHHLRGAGAGLHLDRRLYLDPQHGGVDDRRLRRRRAARSASCRSSAPWSISRAIA